MSPPVGESSHIKAMYNHITSVFENNVSVLGAAMSYLTFIEKEQGAKTNAK